MKIKEHYLDKNNGESKIFLDLEGKTFIMYVTKDGKQLLNNIDCDLSTEQVHSIFKFIEEYLETISENNETQSVNEQSKQSANSENQTPDTSSEGAKPIPSENSESSGENIG